MKKLFALLLLFAVSLSVLAQPTNFPDKPVKIITSLPVGSGPDSVIRFLAEKLSKKWNVPVVVENKPGGSGAVALNAYNKEPADGYTIYHGDASNFISYPILYNNEKITENIEPLAPLAIVDMMLMTSPKNQNFAELTTAIKKNPTFGSWGIGSPSQIAGAELAEFLNIPSTHIPYKDYSVWLVDTGNQVVTSGFIAVGSAAQLEKAGKIKFIAFTGNQRDPQYPNVPTLTELTGKKLNIVRPWTAFYINKSVPDNVKQKLHRDFTYELNQPETAERMHTLYYKPWKITISEFNKFLNEQYNLYKSLVIKYNITVN